MKYELVDNKEIREAEPNIICQCKHCNKVFDFKERGKVNGGHGVKNDVCPYCKGSFTVIKSDDKNHLDKYLYVNTDYQYYHYK